LGCHIRRTFVVRGLRQSVAVEKPGAVLELVAPDSALHGQAGLAPSRDFTMGQRAVDELLAARRRHLLPAERDFELARDEPELAPAGRIPHEGRVFEERADIGDIRDDRAGPVELELVREPGHDGWRGRDVRRTPEPALELRLDASQPEGAA
jgi:hypothetical protein